MAQEIVEGRSPYLVRYDTNGDGSIDNVEFQKALSDYAAGDLHYSELLEVMRFVSMPFDEGKAAPVVASALSDVSGLTAGNTQDVSLSGVFSDADGDSLTISATSSNEAIATVTVTSDGSTLTVAGVAEGTATIMVTAQDSDGNSVSDAFDVSVASTPELQPVEIPGPVVRLELTATSDSLMVRWQAPESGDAPNRYIVHINPQGKGKGTTKRTKAKKTSVTFRNLEASKTYKVWVRAQNDAGKGARTHASITLPPAELEQEDGQQQQQGTPN